MGSDDQQRGGSSDRPVAAALLDPLGAITSLGAHASRQGLVVGFALAVASHGAAVGPPMAALHDMRDAVVEIREGLHEYFWTNYDIEVVDEDKADNKEEPEEEPEPEVEPEEAEPEPVDPSPLPEPPPDDAPEPEESPYDDTEPPPAPAEAADVLTAEADDEAVDLTGFDIVDKDGSKATGAGYTSAKGTDTKPVYDKNAKVGGVPGAKGTGEPKPPPPPRRRRKKDLSRTAGVSGGLSWNCPFPPQADAEQVHRAAALVVVKVGTSGQALSATVVSDPGYGFGAAARRCAMGRRYKPGLDADGRPKVATTPPIRVSFRR
jgi:protein TonB